MSSNMDKQKVDGGVSALGAKGGRDEQQRRGRDNDDDDNDEGRGATAAAKSSAITNSSSGALVNSDSFPSPLTVCVGVIDSD